MFEEALSGAKVVDLTHYIAGPYCTKLLADFGADVIKVEKPGEGDGARRMGPFLKDEPHPEKSGLFAYLNTNKRSLTLNLKTETGRDILLQLAEEADILVESFAPRVMPGLGLTYGRLREINPHLVLVSLSSFGQTGPYRDFKASELVLNAMGGEMYSRGITTREPLKLGGNAVQLQAGTIAALATTIALWNAEETDEGDHLDISIFETQISSIDLRGTYLLAYQYNRRVGKRRDPAGESGYPEGIYRCKDGYVYITGGSLYWDRIMKMLDNPEELRNPMMRTPPGQANPELRSLFEAYFLPWCLERTKQEIFFKGQAANVLCGPINTMEDVLKDPHFLAREFFAEVDHPALGKVTIPGEPFKMGETPWKLNRPAPLLGEHNAEILGELGYNGEDIVRLREAGII